MNGARHEFLSSARLTGDKHGRLHLGHRFDHLIDSLHAIGLANDVGQLSAGTLAFDEGFVLLLQGLLFPDDRDFLKCARDFLFQELVIERFVNEVEGAEKECLMCGLFVSESRHHDDFYVGLQLSSCAQKLDAAHIRHLNV